MEYLYLKIVFFYLKVRSVASITLVSLSRITSSQGNSHSFPLGVNAKFSVSLHDNVGRKFDVSSIQLKHRIQRYSSQFIVSITLYFDFRL